MERKEKTAGEEKARPGKRRSQGMLPEVLRASAAGRAPGATTQAVSAGSRD